MNDKRTKRLLLALTIVREAGSVLRPSWNPHAREGFTYNVFDVALDNERFRNDLEELARAGYLERVFVDRLSLCPHCASHALNAREVCIACRSPHLVRTQALLHFRCGYVGAVNTYAEEPQGRRCPKCRKILQDIGTDHDSPCEYYSCCACNTSFQIPDIGTRCLSCGSHFAGADMERITQRDVFAYRLLELGEAALETECFLDDPDA